MQSQRQTLMSLLLFGVVVVLVVVWISSRNSIAVPSQGEWWAIQDATIISMNPKDPESFKGTVLGRGDTIVKVDAQVKLPKNTKVISGVGKILTPGIALAGTRLGLVEISLEGSTRNDSKPGRAQLRPGFRVHHPHLREGWQCRGCP